MCGIASTFTLLLRVSRLAIPKGSNPYRICVLGNESNPLVKLFRASSVQNAMYIYM
jgi:hypothetical protein